MRLQCNEAVFLRPPQGREMADAAMIRATSSTPVWMGVIAILLAAILPFSGRAAEARAAAGAAQQVLRVGPAQQYMLPSEAARAARDGALVEIYSGDYEGDV